MIEVNNLNFTYKGHKERTLKELTFRIKPGEIFGLLGPSGAGKSTTQKILTGLLQDYEGSAVVLGREMGNATRDYYERIGVAFEFPNFYSRFTAMENLQLFGSLYKGPVTKLSELLALVGLEEDADRKLSEFSKGMKMRLNFCRALLNKPDILFLDEPTSGLDPVNAKRMKELILLQKERGACVLINTHNMQVAEELCDQVAFLVDGTIRLINSPRELKLSRGARWLRVEYSANGKKHAADFDLIGLGSNTEFRSLIERYPIETMHSMEATLEQIFIDVTGRSLS